MQIECSNLCVGYNNIAVRENINFSINSGDYICVVGENGVGKSTFMKTLLGLIPRISGEILLEDGLKSTDIGYLPQQTQIQKDFPASVFEVVISGCLNKTGFRPFYNKSEKQLATDMIEKLNITNLIKKSYSQLSGGQQQRVLLARALCATNKILLLDEPTAGLDANSTKEFYAYVKKLHNQGITIIMITHNLNDVFSDTEYVLTLKLGETLYQSKDEYLQKENN